MAHDGQELRIRKVSKHISDGIPFRKLLIINLQSGISFKLD